ncbi:BfmA/BtgA family mobilization protein [Cellulophaga fucicola]|uniref:BfmA/BtgA family mobilization protein n=1 Tax=Cellulophaga fucicola TaxID=76595 RepID=UPI003EC03C53
MHNSKKNKYKTIRIYNSSFEQINEFCEHYKLSKTELIETFLNYFHKTKLDPRVTTDVATDVKKLKNQLISFIRKQEKDKLDPLVKKQDILIEKSIAHYKNTFEYHKTNIDTLNKRTTTLIDNQKILDNKLKLLLERK